MFLAIAAAFYASPMSAGASETVSGAVYNSSSPDNQYGIESIPGYGEDSLLIKFNDTEVTKNYTYFYFENPHQVITFAYYLDPNTLPYNLEFSICQENQEIGFYYYGLFDTEDYYEVDLKEGLNRFSVQDNFGYLSAYINIVYIPPTANAQRRGEIMQAVIDADAQSVDEYSFLAAESTINAQLAIPYDNFEDKISLSGVSTPLSMDKYYNLLYTDQDSVQFNVEVNGSAKVFIDGVQAQSLNRAKATIPLTLSKYFTKIEVQYETTNKDYYFCIIKLPPGLDAEFYQDMGSKANAANDQCVDQASYDQNIADMELYMDQVINDLRIIRFTGLAGNQDFGQPYQIYATDQPSLKVSTFAKEPATIIFNGADIGSINGMWKEANLNLNNEGNVLEIQFGNEIYQIYLFALISQVRSEIKTALFSAAAESNAHLSDEADYEQAIDRLADIYNCNQEGKVKKLAAGYSHYLALLEDGTVVAWDQNGNLLDVPETANKVKDIGAGNDYSVALKEDGTLVAWGSIMTEVLNVPAGLNNVRTISAGPYFCLALKNDGTVVEWGPMISQLPAGLSQVKAISAGKYHALALKENGTVVGWGRNDYGEISIPAELTNIQAISAGEYLSLLLKADGTVAIIDYNYSSNYPAYLTGVKDIFCGDQDTNYAILTNGAVKRFTESALYSPYEIGDVAGNGKKARQIVATNNNYYQDPLILMEDGTVYSPQNHYQPILQSFIKKHASIGPVVISKSHSIFYFENPNQTLNLIFNSDCQVNFNGQLIKSFTNSSEAIPLVLLPGKNDLEMTFSNGVFSDIKKVAIFYLPPENGALFRQAVINQVIAADAASIDDNSFQNGINSILSLKILSLTELGYIINKPYAIRFSTAGQINLSYGFGGSLAVSVNGSPAVTSNALYGNIPISLNLGQNEIIVQYTKEGTQAYKISIFYLPSESSSVLRETVSKAIIAADGRAIDEASYQQEVAGIPSAKNLFFDYPTADLNRHFYIQYTESHYYHLGVVAYASAKVIQDFVEITSFSQDYQYLSFDLHNGVNNFEVQFGAGATPAVYKICVFRIPDDAEPGFRANISAAVAAAQQKSFDQNSYNMEIKGIIQRNKYVAFTNFTGSMDTNRKYRILYTEGSQLSIQCSTAERADVTMVKMSNGSSIDGSESYVVGASTGNFTIPLVEGRNVLQISFTEFGEVTTYYYAIFRGSSQFGSQTKNNIINAVINADNALVNNDGLTYTIKLADVSNTYFWNLNSNWFKWL